MTVRAGPEVTAPCAFGLPAAGRAVMLSARAYVDMARGSG